MVDFQLRAAGPPVKRIANGAKYPWALPEGMPAGTEYPVPEGENHRTRSAASQYELIHPGVKFTVYDVDGQTYCKRLT